MISKRWYLLSPVVVVVQASREIPGSRRMFFGKESRCQVNKLVHLIYVTIVYFFTRSRKNWDTIYGVEFSLPLLTTLCNAASNFCDWSDPKGNRLLHATDSLWKSNFEAPILWKWALLIVFLEGGYQEGLVVYLGVCVLWLAVTGGVMWFHWCC